MEQEIENVDETQQVEETKFKSTGDDSIIKVDLSKPIENEKPEEPKENTTDSTDNSGVVGGNESTPTAEKQEEVQPEGEVQEEIPVNRRKLLKQN